MKIEAIQKKNDWMRKKMLSYSDQVTGMKGYINNLSQMVVELKIEVLNKDSSSKKVRRSKPETCFNIINFEMGEDQTLDSIKTNLKIAPN